MNPSYILSTNYEKLYSLIEAGHTVAGFVTTESYTNDIVQIRNNGVGDLQICARGIIYGEVPNYWKDYQPEASEIGLFKASCQSLRLQYIVPNAGWKKFPENKPETPHRYCLLKLDGEGDDDFRFYWDGEKFLGLKSRCLAFLEIPEFKPE